MHRQMSAFCVGLALQHLQCRLADLVLRVAFVPAPRQQTLPGARKAENVIHVPVGLVQIDPARQPDHFFGAEIFLQCGFDFGFGKVRVAPLGQKALFGYHHGALSVRVNGAALQHKSVGTIAVGALQFTDLLRNQIVRVPGEIQPVHKASPGVELPIHPTERLAVGHKSGPAVAHPGVVVGGFHPHAGIQHGTRVAVLPGADQHGHRFKCADCVRHFGKYPLCGLAAIAPVVRALRPDDISAAVFFKFARHPVAVCLGRGIQFIHIVPFSGRSVFRFCRPLMLFFTVCRDQLSDHDCQQGAEQ